MIDPKNYNESFNNLFVELHDNLIQLSITQNINPIFTILPYNTIVPLMITTLERVGSNVALFYEQFNKDPRVVQWKLMSSLVGN